MRARRLLLAVAAAILAVAGGGPAGAAAGGSAASQSGSERITNYDVSITIERSGDLTVTEVIDYDFGVTSHHGIFRNIPVRLHYDDRFDRVYPVSIRSVVGSPGTPDQFDVSNEGGDKVLKIGDPDKTVTGPHRYTIDYVVKGGLNGFPEHDELYWNAIGTEWGVPVEQGTAHVSTPGPLTEITCFSGPIRSLLPCGQSDAGDQVATFATGRLEPHEAFTVVVGFQKGFVPPPTPVLDERWAFDRAFALTPGTMGATAGLLVLVVGGVGALLWRTGRDQRFAGSAVDIAFGSDSGAEQKVPLLERPLTPVEFAPPDDLRPGQVGTLVDETASTLDVTATIVDLAVRGFLRIDEIPKEGWFGKKDWNLVELKEATGLRNYEHSLLSAIFRGRSEVKLSALKNTFATDLKKVEDLLYDDAVAQGWFARRPDRTRTLWTVLGVLALVGSIAVAAVVAATTHFGLVGIPLVAGGLILLLGAKRMPRRTAKGTGTLRRVQGFRRFIEESEKERARFAERKNLFSEYLPYAIVFGATEKWAKAFADIDGRLPETGWYSGPGYFTVGSFSDSMDGFSTTTSGTISSTPSGSGGSGFGGGGFSGGGGGGGGGGSW
ncbi:MAG: hypothetical protein QOG43_3015 [Actinomycetota bacterium]|nr:hypothetical protein [Actinomycetota bacterium]